MFALTNNFKVNFYFSVEIMKKIEYKKCELRGGGVSLKALKIRPWCEVLKFLIDPAEILFLPSQYLDIALPSTYLFKRYFRYCLSDISAKRAYI